MKKIPLGVKVFTLLWALAVLLPPVREMWRAVSSYSNFGTPTFDTRQKSIPAADPITVEWKMEEKDYTQGGYKANDELGELDALAARFPGQLWIVAARLRRSFPPELSLDTVAEKPPANPPQWVDPRDFNRVALIAANAGKRESDNAFWPWMEAIFRFALHQNNEGAACMERAANAPRFDDCLQSTVRARMALWDKYDHPPYEQKIGAWSAVLFPQLGPMREASAATAYQALLARRRGDTPRALRLGSAILRANKLWRRDSWMVIGSIVAEGSARGALDKLFGETPPKGSGMPDATAAHKRKLKEDWARFARDNGRPDLASDADWVALPSVTESVSNYWGQMMWAQFGLPTWQAVLAFIAPMLLVAVGAICFASATIRLVGALVAWRRKSGTLPSRGQVVACANFSFWALLGALATASPIAWMLGKLVPYWGEEQAGAASPFLLFYCATLPAGCWLLPVAFVAWKRDHRFRWVRSRRPAQPLSRAIGRARVVAWLLLLTSAVFASTSVSSGAAYRGDVWAGTPFQLPVSASLAVISLVAAFTLEVVRYTRSGRALPRLRLEGEAPSRAAAPLTLRMARAGAWAGGIWCVFSTWAAAVGSLDLPPLAGALQVPLGILLVTVAILLGRKIGPGDSFAFRLATRTAGVLSLAWSVMFLVVALAVWPLRVEMNRQLAEAWT